MPYYPVIDNEYLWPSVKIVMPSVLLFIIYLSYSIRINGKAKEGNHNHANSKIDIKTYNKEMNKELIKQSQNYQNEQQKERLFNKYGFILLLASVLVFVLAVFYSHVGIFAYLHESTYFILGAILLLISLIIMFISGLTTTSREATQYKNALNTVAQRSDDPELKYIAESQEKNFFYLILITLAVWYIETQLNIL